MEDEIATLRIMSRESSEWSIPAARQVYEKQLQKRKAERAARDEVIRAEYFEILNANPDLSQRKLKLSALIKKVGFDGLWTKRDSKNRRRSYPPESVEEWIWYDASQEITKIDMILSARMLTVKEGDDESGEEVLTSESTSL